MIWFDSGPNHDIRIDPATLLVDVRVMGFVSATVAEVVRDAARKAVRSLGPDVGRHVTLYDATEMRVTGWPTIEQIKDSFAEPGIEKIWARRVAICSPSDKVREQLGQLREVRPDFGVFAERNDALAWLLAAEDDEPSAA